MVHIGEKIKARAKELRIGPTELGNLINTSKQNIYTIYKRKSLDSELLRKISMVLRYDFFLHYIPEGKWNEAQSGYFTRKDFIKLSFQLEKSQKENENLKKEMEILKDKMKLLEKIAELQGRRKSG